MYTTVDFFKDFPLALVLLLILIAFVIAVLYMVIDTFTWNSKIKEFKENLEGTVPESSNNE